jgi:RNA polymerase sigma-70 factor (ECF subfamily)
MADIRPRRDDLYEEQRRVAARLSTALVGLDEVEASLEDGRQSIDQQETLDRLWALIQKLKPQDKQVILLYLEGMDAASIGEITGFSPSNVATKIHRIKNLLSRRFHDGERRAE